MILKKEPLIKKLILLLSLFMILCFSILNIFNYYFLNSTNLDKINLKTIVIINIVFSLIIIVITIIAFFYIVKLFIEKLEKISIGIDKINDGNFPVEFNFDKEGILSRLESQFYQMGRRIQLNLEELSLEKENIKSLVTDISHQIKTPLASIKMFNSILIDDELSSEEEKEFLGKSHQEILKLQGLSDALIKVSKMEIGLIELKKDHYDIKTTILEAVNSIYLKALEKNIDISINNLDCLMIDHDRKWTTEAIFNVLENAIKYTENKGQIIISLENLKTYIKIDIQDNGIGIKEKDKNRVFERFYRGSNETVENSEGSGIGLYLAKKIIEDQGGSLIFSSQENVGTRFSIILILQNCKKPLIKL